MCGIVGVIGNYNVRDDIMDSIKLLSHRGQEAAGLLLFEGDRDHLLTTAGDISRIVDNADFPYAHGRMGVAHLRYGTTGGGSARNAQPFLSRENGTGFVHNGQVQNMIDLEILLEKHGKPVHTESDAELLLGTFLLSLEGRGTDAVFSAVKRTQQLAVGGYACILPMKDTGLLAFRDPNGIRPLVMGTKDNGDGRAIAFASESVALDLSGFTDIKDVQHGEAVLVRPDLSIERRVLLQRDRRNCAFEYFYFADASSVMESLSVNRVRYATGKRLAQQDGVPTDIDMVVPVPNTPRAAAGGFSEASGIPYKDVIYKAPSFGRIFITPGQGAREKKAKQAFRYDGDAFTGKRVMLIDDSIVRGTNMREIIKQVRGFGATEVHVGVTWPAIISSCPYGIDIPNGLMAQDRTLDERRLHLGADSLTYASPADVLNVIGHTNLCMACTTLDYPTAGLIHEPQKIHRRQR